MIVNAVIVTYNRKKLLNRCLSALLDQSVTVHRIYVIDNASSDGTKACLVEKGYASEDPHDNPVHIDKTAVHYIRLDENIGGAGGFHEGIKHAYHDDTDYVWIMDDDGYPSGNCLEKQLEYANRYDYIIPVSLDTETTDKLTWYIRKKNGQRTRSYAVLSNSFKTGYMSSAVPFNGLLMSRTLIDRVGLPKKEMFIWGDDYDHQYRCINAGFKTITALDAVFYHPEDKASHFRILFRLIPINYTESTLRFTCLIRNSTYNYWNHQGKYKIVLKFLMYSWFFILVKKFDIRGYVYYLKCVGDGIRGDFTRHKQYIK